MATVRTLIGNIKGPKGDTGATGATGPQGPGATIEVGTVSTTAYGNPVQITNSGTETDAVLDFVIPQGKPGEQTTKMSLLTLDTITTQTTEYPIPAVGDVGSTAWGKIVKFFNDIKTAVTGKVDTTSIVNNLTSTATNVPLSAAQGKALNDALASLNPTAIENIDGVSPTVFGAHADASMAGNNIYMQVYMVPQTSIGFGGSVGSQRKIITLPDKYKMKQSFRVPAVCSLKEIYFLYNYSDNSIYVATTDTSKTMAQSTPAYAVLNAPKA